MAAVVSEKETILLVDDHPGFLDELGTAIRGEGWEAVTAGSAAAALECATGCMPGIAVVGQGLPDGDGTTLIRDLRRRCPGVLCILMTSHPDLANAMGAVSARAYGYLIKPFPPAQLTALIGSALEVRALRQDYQHEITRAVELQAIVHAARIVQDRINNPLQRISGNAELIRMLAPELPERARELLTGMVQACREMGDLVHRLAQVIVEQPDDAAEEGLHDARALTKLLTGLDDEGIGGLPSPEPARLPVIPDDDRRSHKRYACRNLVLSIPLGGTESWHYIDNISQGGVAVTMLIGGAVPPRFQARVLDMDAGEAMPVEVEHRWSREGPPATAGFRFVNRDEHTHEWLESILSRLGPDDPVIQQG